MKKLGKLSINVDKIIKNEELVNLKGGDYYGYGLDTYYCRCGSEGSYTGGVFTVTVAYNDIYGAIDQAVAHCGGSPATATCSLYSDYF